MAWHQIGNNLLSEPVQTQFTDTNMRHYGGMNKFAKNTPVSSPES